MTKDLVLDGFVQNFSEKRGLTHLDESEIFEAFVASSIFRKFHHCDVNEIEENFLVGGSHDGGIDAIGILVNGRPVRSEEDVKFFVDTLRRLEVEFVFIQAKTSGGFSSADIGQFTFGVQQFFSSVLGSQPRIKLKDEITLLIELTKNIFRQTISMQENPKCSIYYSTSGKWVNDIDPDGRLKACCDHLNDLKLFSNVSAHAIDGEYLKSIYRDLERSVDRHIELSKTAVFPQIDGVEDAYIGLMPGDEFIKLVSNDEGELNRELFLDNVRDYQGDNPVNKDIRSTLSQKNLRRNFPLLNNGVTITARSILRRGDVFTIRDFQIVNGCQTTHILFQSREHIDSNIFIPVKLVATTDSQIVNEVIKATNRQTAVLPEALESLTSFHKELEDFYNIQGKNLTQKNRIYYERRSKQFLMDNISQSSIVTLTGQIKSFVGMFLNEPHSHPRYYGELLQSYAGRIFLADHKPAPYYASGFGLLMLEKWLNSSRAERSLRIYKHHLLMMLRIRFGGAEMPKLNSNKISSYSMKIIDAFRDEIRFNQECETVVRELNGLLSEFDVARKKDFRGNPPHRLRAFTEYMLNTNRSKEIIDTESAAENQPFVGNLETGRIRWFDDWKYYGFISRDLGDDIFFRGRALEALPWHLRVANTKVSYNVVESTRFPGRLMASNIRLVK